MINHVMYFGLNGLGVPLKIENFKNGFFSWSEFYYWTKVKAKCIF